MKKFKYVIEAIGVYLALAIFWILPRRWASNLGGFIGREIGSRMGLSRRAAQHIKIAFPDKTDSEIKSITRDMWDNLGRVMAEYPHLKTIAKHHIKIIGREHLKTLPTDKGWVFIAGHLANWELIPPAFITQTGTPCTVLYRAPNNPYVDRLLNKLRAFKTIPKSSLGVREMVKTLQKGQNLGLLIDQKYNQGLDSNFFGQTAKTSPAFAELAQKYDAPVIPLQIARDTHDPHQFTITIHPPIPTQDREISDIVDDAHHLLEDWIRQAPAGWLWIHRRWG